MAWPGRRHRRNTVAPQVGLSSGSPLLESIGRKEEIGVIGTDYSVGDRRVEQTILALAIERRIGVMAYYPFGRADSTCPGASGPPPSASRSLFTRVGTRPLPEWAAEFDARTWAQSFLEYVISHPAVTAVRAETSKASHMLDDIAGGQIL